jgi:hypothetical protein
MTENPNRIATPGKKQEGIFRGGFGALLYLLPFLLAAWLYLPAVQLPFFWDDVVHFRYVSRVSTEHLLTRTELVSYYRPIVNLLLQIPFKLDQMPYAPSWHLLLVWNHLLNIALVGALARKLRMSRIGIWAAMLLFAVYPFSFQAVVWVLAWFHPFVMTALLVPCLAGVHWMQNPSRWGMLALAWIVGCLAPFIHENGVLAAPLMVWVVLFAVSWNTRRMLQLVAPVAVASLLYLLILLRLDVLGGGDPRTAADLQFNLAYFAQGLSYPLQFIMGRFGSDSDAQTRVWIGMGIFAAVLAWRRDSRRILLFGLGWFAAASLPAILLLTEEYVANSPRLLYVGSAGVVMLIACLLDRGWQAGRFWALLSTIAFGSVLLGSVLFVREELRLHHALGTGYNELHSELKSGASPVLVVNAPMYLEAHQKTFPMGKMGAIFVTNYFGMNDFVWVNTGVEYYDMTAGAFWESLDPWPGYATGFNGILIPDRGNMHGYTRGNQRVFVFHVLDESRFTARLVGQQVEPSENGLYTFGDSLRLNSLETSEEGEFLVVRLTWQKLDAPWTLPFHRPFVHLLCGDTIISQSDAAPIDNLYDLDVWEPNETWVDLRYLRLDESPEDCLRLRLGVYDPNTGNRAAIADADGAPLESDFLLLPLEP